MPLYALSETYTLLLYHCTMLQTLPSRSLDSGQHIGGSGRCMLEKGAKTGPDPPLDTNNCDKVKLDMSAPALTVHTVG